MVPRIDSELIIEPRIKNICFNDCNFVCSLPGVSRKRLKSGFYFFFLIILFRTLVNTLHRCTTTDSK